MYFFFLFFLKKMKKWSPYNYTDLNFKLTKYQHLELILRENKLTYTKLILNEADSETKIESERSKEKKSQMSQKSGRHYSGLCTLHQYFTTGGKPSTWFPPGGLVEQNFRARNFEKNRILNLRLPLCLFLSLCFFLQK